MPANSRQYYRTEQEIAKLFKSSGLPIEFTNPFTKDYAAVKGDIATSDSDLQQLQSDIDQLSLRVDSAEDDIAEINTDIASLNVAVLNLTLQASDFDDRLIIVEDDLSGLATDFSAHELSQSAHGATGDIVGTGDYCTALIGGTVLLASAIADKPNYNIPVTLTAGAAPAAYNQAYIQTLADMLNDIASKYNLLNANYGALITVVNSIKNTQVTAKQRAP